MIILYVTAFVLGTVFGSFFNVVIWRFPRGESLSHPPSACPRCGTPVAPRDNIPVVSWLLLRGRCRGCAEPISMRYPIVELLTGVLWLAAAVRFGLTARTGVAVVFFSFLLILAYIDWDTMRLPNPLVAWLAGLGGVAVLFTQVSDIAAAPLLDPLVLTSMSPLGSAVAGALGSAGIALALAGVYAVIRKRSGFGMGDVKLLGAIGLYLGLYGVLVLFVGAMFGAVYAIVAATRDSEFVKRAFPFGPFLAIAAVAIALFGPQVMGWYLGLLGNSL